MSDSLLPEQFMDLSPLAKDWALATETERNRKRLSSGMEEMETFRDAVLPRMDAMMEYLNQFPLRQLPEDAKRLLFLAFSLAEVAPALELYGQPAGPDAFDSARFVADEDFILRARP
jgi:hypothetical protein